MSQRLTISVAASEDRPEQLSVQDAFTHVVDLFKLLSQSEPDQVVWRLVSVHMNSPLTVVAEAVPVRAGAAIDAIAVRQITDFSTRYGELQQGIVPREWSAPEPRKLIGSLLWRNHHSISRTYIDLGNELPKIEINPENSVEASITLSAVSGQKKRFKDQVGSIEGKLLLIDQYYGKPAIQILERKSKQKIWCVVPDEFQHPVSENTSVEDVWKGSRVIVKGTIGYASEGKISRVIATEVLKVEPKKISEDTLADATFTGGLSVSKYLEKFRDGDLD